jgi:ABC-type uncharacterized transport system YnjBCD substrate-binding protein
MLLQPEAQLPAVELTVMGAPTMILSQVLPVNLAKQKAPNSIKCNQTLMRGNLSFTIKKSIFS